MSTTLRAAVVAAAGTAAVLMGVSVPASAATTPTITSLSPSAAPIGGIVAIHGQGLTGATFTIHSVVLPPTSTGRHDDSEVDVTVPNGAATGRVVGHIGTTSFTGPIFSVQQATKATEQLSKHNLTYPHRVTVTGTLALASTGAALKGQRARLQRRVHGSTTWRTLKGTSVKRTSSHGTVSWSVAPGQNVGLRIRFASSKSRAGVITGQQILGVRPALHVSLPHTLQSHEPSSLTGTVNPHLAGRVVVQRRVDGKWHTVATPTAKRGGFSVSVIPEHTGKYAYRVTRPADASHHAAASRVLTARAISRSLRLGDSGKDVGALQAQLRHLHYDVGPKSDVYGYDLLHAVTAFEKVQGLPRDGAAGTKVQQRLGHPKTIHLRHPIPGAAVSVEVDLYRQVLLIAKHGHIWRILDTSTAGGYYYTDSEGQTEKAVTPTGHFSIKYKEEGTVHSKLGTLYRPSYFNYTGYAIHGEGNGNDGGEVPPYPNSHGCVRITNNAVNRYYNLLAVGVSVWIY